MFCRFINTSKRYNSSFAKAALESSAKKIEKDAETIVSSKEAQNLMNHFASSKSNSFLPSTNRTSSVLSQEILGTNNLDPYTFATKFVVPDKIAGRSMIVNGDLDRAISRFDYLVRSNRLREISNDQRFFTKPNKKRLAKRVANRKKVFEAGIANLFKVVKDAIRKGY